MAKPLSQAPAEIGLRLVALSRSHQDPELARMMAKLGQAARLDAKRAASADLGGDPAFSGWRRGAPIQLDTVTRYMGNGAQYVGPARKAAGLWTVAERGRNADGGVGAFQGPGVNRRTGMTMRTRTGRIRNSRAKGRRYNGQTAGKNTATDAREITARETPKRLRQESLKVMTAAFKKGR